VPNESAIKILKERVSKVQDWSYVDKFKKLSEFKIELAPHPELSLSNVNALIAEIQKKKDELHDVTQEAIRHKQIWESALNAAKRLYKKEKDALLKEKDIIEMKNQLLQMAEVDHRLSELVSVINYLEDKVQKSEDYLESCKATLENLDSTNKNLVQQIKVIQQMIDIRELSKGKESYVKEGSING
jgi:DNA repair ATPase RecN